MQRVREAPLPCSSHWVLVDLIQTVLSTTCQIYSAKKPLREEEREPSSSLGSPFGRRHTRPPPRFGACDKQGSSPSRRQGCWAAARRGHVRRTLCAHVCEGERRGAGPAQPGCVYGCTRVYMCGCGCTRVCRGVHVPPSRPRTGSRRCWRGRAPPHAPRRPGWALGALLCRRSLPSRGFTSSLTSETGAVMRDSARRPGRAGHTHGGRSPLAAAPGPRGVPLAAVQL